MLNGLRSATTFPTGHSYRRAHERAEDVRVDEEIPKIVVAMRRYAQRDN